MTLVMGVLNVTPDSFSDGGRWLDTAEAVAHGHQMIDQGARIIDIGGESTRPGARRPDAVTEASRVLPVVAELASRVVVSVDTMRASTASAAIAAGAKIINDVSGGLSDPQMLPMVAEAGVDYICQHWRGYGYEMDANTNYTRIVDEVLGELQARIQACRQAGIPEHKIIIDPGLGFAKTAEQDWALLSAIDRFVELGYRVLVGASRKRFVGQLLAGREPGGRDAATAAISTWCALNGVWGVRTHEIYSQVDAVAVGERIRAGRLSAA